MPPTDIIILLLTGLFAGLLGGLVGIGGSIIIIPALTLLLHKHQQLSQASAMIINVAVAVPAMLQHQRARAVRWDVVWRMLPFGIVFIILGVEASNRLSAELLMKLFGVFLIYIIYTNIRQMIQRNPESRETSPAHFWLGSAIAGSITGLFAGVLGIGGGVIAVPLLQRVCHLPLRQCIATSSAVMCLTAILGALRKNMTLASLVDSHGVSLGLSASQSIVLAAWLAPTAIVGSMIGARLVHTLPLNVVRIALIVLLGIACVQFLW